MENIHILMTGLTAVILFIFGLENFSREIEAISSGEMAELQQAAGEMQTHLDDANKDLLKLMADPGRRDAGAMTNFVTYSQRLKDKLVNYASLKTK